MEYVVAVLAFLAIVAILVFALKLHNDNKNAKVVQNSVKISKLTELNKSIGFHDVTKDFDVYRHYDNKSNYNKIEPSYLMTAEIRDNIEFFSQYVAKVRENRSKLPEYQRAISNILSTECSIDFEKLNISKAQFLRREKKLFDKNTLSPVVDCSFVVEMTYSSPQGRVQLAKEDSFCFDEVYACLESISRSRLDKNTYNNLAAVERGEVSDSLRYDILNRDNFTCVICGASSRQGARLHVDHIVPISKGGKSTPSNLRTLCERCNIGKSNKIESDFAAEEKETVKHNDVCDLCGAKLVLRKGKYGEFYGCSRYPECKFTKKL